MDWDYTLKYHLHLASKHLISLQQNELLNI